jgi:hypothetical protein
LLKGGSEDNLGAYIYKMLFLMAKVDVHNDDNEVMFDV